MLIVFSIIYLLSPESNREYKFICDYEPLSKHIDTICPHSDAQCHLNIIYSYASYIKNTHTPSRKYLYFDILSPCPYVYAIHLYSQIPPIRNCSDTVIRPSSSVSILEHNLAAFFGAGYSIIKERRIKKTHFNCKTFSSTCNTDIVKLRLFQVLKEVLPTVCNFQNEPQKDFLLSVFFCLSLLSFVVSIIYNI